MSNTPKSGVRTTEFWVTLLTVVSGAVTAVDPSVHLNGYVRGAAFVAAAVSGAVYTIARKGLKAELADIAADIEGHANTADTASVA